MKIEVNNTRVVKSAAATEVFITRDSEPYINTVLHLPPDAKIESGDGIEFVVVAPKPLAPAEAKAAAKNLPGQIEPAQG